MKVYVVKVYDYDICDIVGVYSTEAAARAAAEKAETDYIYETEIDSAEPPRDLPEPPKRYWWDEKASA